MLLADRIIYIDAEAIILDKPAGLPVDEPRDGSLSVMSHLDSLRFGFTRVPLVVHRLDRDTSGCLLMARNPRAQKKFSASFEAGGVEKIYIALLDGDVAEGEGVVDMPLAKVSTREDGWRMVADPKGKTARTRWTRLIVRDGKTLVAFRPETGRTHQLRVHAASGMGYPIVGDPIYGTGNGPMMLHASGLSLPRPGKVPAAATAQLPPHFIAAGFSEGVGDG